MSLHLAEVQLEEFLVKLQLFISELQRANFNIGVDSYCTVHNLLLVLADQGQLNGDFSQLRTLIAPLLCCAQEEQEIFYRKFNEFFSTLEPQQKTNPEIINKPDYSEKTYEINPLPIIPNVPTQTSNTSNTSNTKIFLGLAFSLLLIFAFINYRGELNSSYSNITNHTVTSNQPNPALQKTYEPQVSEFSDTNTTKFVFQISLAILLLMLCWYSIHYLKLHLFLKRRGALQPPDMTQFFIKNQHNLYSSIHFSHIAQQLHKHYDLDTHSLNIEETVKRTSQACGFYTPIYKALKVLPEYLVLIDRASFNDQSSQFVNTLLNQLDDFGLFIERYYFDGDPRYCYPQFHPTMHCTLESLKNSCTSHRLIIFSDTRNFFDPITGNPYTWLTTFYEWQKLYLFTLESDGYWDYYKQQLYEFGFVVLTTGQKGLVQLANYVLTDKEIRLQKSNAVDTYPSLLRQRPRRFLERHAPAPAVLDELLSQLSTYLDGESFDWLAACAVYPELHWHLTLYLGTEYLTNLKRQSGVDEELLRLIRLPWFRYGYMPDWLREALLLKLNDKNKPKELVIRKHLQELLLMGSFKGYVDSFSLSVAQESMREILLSWKNHTGSDNAICDYVFLSFMSGLLAFKLPEPINRYLIQFGLETKILLVLVLLSNVALTLVDIELKQSLFYVEKINNLQTENFDTSIESITQKIDQTQREIDQTKIKMKEALRLGFLSMTPGTNGSATTTYNPIVQSFSAKIQLLEQELSELQQKQQQLMQEKK